jgi:putative peptidoglycan lipid II flippase
MPSACRRSSASRSWRPATTPARTRRRRSRSACWEFAGPHAGLALASSISAFLNAGLLYRGLRRRDAYRPGPGWLRLGASVALACLVMVAVLGTWTPGLDVWMAMTAFTRATDLLVYVVTGAAVYALVAWIAGVRPHHFARGAL